MFNAAVTAAIVSLAILNIGSLNSPATARVVSPAMEASVSPASYLLKVQQSQRDQQAFIREVQESLQALGLYQGPIDGVWGPASQRGLNEFMRRADYRGEFNDTRQSHLWWAAYIRRARDVSAEFAIREAPALARANEDLVSGNQASSEGRYADAEALHRRALALRERVLGPEHRDTLRSLNNLAVSLADQGRHADAKALYRRTLDARERVLGPEHPETLNSLNNLANSLNKQGRHADAEALHRRALALRERVLGPEHHDTLGSLNNLALSLFSQGRHADVEALHRRTLDARERILGPEHRDTLASLNNLAESIRLQGRHAEAEALHRRALALRERILGPEHRDTLRSLNNLALSLADQGRHADAEGLHRRTLEAQERVLGPEHRDTLRSLNNLANSFADQGRHADAEALYRRALDARERVLGPEHPDTLNSLNNLANSLANQGRHADAEGLHRRALDAQERVLGPEHPETLRIRNNLSLNLLKIDNSRSLSIWEEGFPALPNYLVASGRISGRENNGPRIPLDLGLYLSTLRNAALDDDERAERSFLVQGFLTYGTLDVALGDQAARGGLADEAAGKALRELQDAREALEQRRRAYLASFEDESRAVARTALAQGMREAEAWLTETAAVIARDFPTLAELELPQPLSAEEARTLLAPGEGLVAFAATDETLYAWFAKKETISWQAIDISRVELARRVAHLRSAVDLGASAPTGVSGECALRGRQSWLSDRPFDLCAARQLHDLLLGGFDLDGVSELIVVADGPLQQMPFSLLVLGEHPDGTPRWLVEDRAIVALPTTSSLRALRQDTRTSASDDRRPFLGFAPVTFDGPGEGSPLRATLTDLPATGDEVRFLAGVLGAGADGAILGDAASETKVKSMALDRYRVISFATHGLLSSESEEVTGGAVREPALVLRAGSGEDGLLTSSEVATLRLDADWVLLSGCNTAGGDGDDARGLSGLARAFFFAGARSLLVSHWSVDDNAAMELMIETVSRDAGSQSRGRAQSLRQAQLTVMNNPDHAHPLFWAPFDLVGDSR